MTAFRSVRPNRAWDARSSSPMYASTSTIRATRGVAWVPPASVGAGVAVGSVSRSGSRTRRAPIRPRAASSVGPARSRRSRSSASGSVEGLGRLGEEEPEEVDDTRDDRLVEDVTGARGRQRLPEAAQERELVDVLGQIEEEVRVEDDHDEREEHDRLEHAQRAAHDLVEPLVLLEQRDLLVGPLDDQRRRDDGGGEHSQEADHLAVLRRELLPLAAQEVAQRLLQVRREEEREHHREDAQQPSDGALHEAQQEGREQGQEDDQVEEVRSRQQIPDVHTTLAVTA